MKKILEKYTQQKSGLFLFNPPTGTGKTYAVLNWIYKNYHKIHPRKIIFITNLKKNLPDEDLKKFFEANDQLRDFEDNVLFIDSNLKFMLENLSKVRDDIQSDLKDKHFEDLKRAVESVKKYENNPSLKGFIEDRKEKIRKTLEPKFRKNIANFLRDKYKTKKKILEAIKKNHKWIGELYPSVYTSERQILFLSLDKFYFKNSTLVEPPYDFIDHKITEDAIVFIDEFDATKDRILAKIIEQGLSQKIDYIKLFTRLVEHLKYADRPTKFFKNSQSRQERIDRGKDSIDVSNIEQRLKDIATEIATEYKTEYSFKAIESQRNKRNLLFHDFEYHAIYSKGTHIRLKPNEKERLNNLIFVPEKLDNEEPSIVFMFSRIKGFLKSFARLVDILARNYRDQTNENRKGNDLEYSYESALSTILEEYGLDGDYKLFIIDLIKNGQRANKPDTLNLNSDFYENGFRYFHFIDDDDQDARTQIFIYNFETTPEKFLLKLAQKALVVGISATAKIDTVVGNYDLEFFKPKLKDTFF